MSTTPQSPRRTPWGPRQHVTVIAEGVERVTTASHGGLWLSAERHRAMPAHLRAIKPFAGGRWYEEDADWSIVALAFPDLFELSAEGARRTFDTWIAPKLARAEQGA